MLLLILNGARVPLSKVFPCSRELLPAAPFQKSPYGPMNLCKSVNRNTSEINVPECRRPADPYIERTRICVLTRKNFCLAATVPKDWSVIARKRARILKRREFSHCLRETIFYFINRRPIARISLPFFWLVLVESRRVEYTWCTLYAYSESQKYSVPFLLLTLNDCYLFTMHLIKFL